MNNTFISQSSVESALFWDCGGTGVDVELKHDFRRYFLCGTVKHILTFHLKMKAWGAFVAIENYIKTIPLQLLLPVLKLSHICPINKRYQHCQSLVSYSLWLMPDDPEAFRPLLSLLIISYPETFQWAGILVSSADTKRIGAVLINTKVSVMENSNNNTITQYAFFNIRVGERV